MIFPILAGLLHPLRAPLTYFLLAINLLVFLATFDAYEFADRRIDALLSDSAFIETQGAVFASMIAREPKAFSSTLNRLAEKSLAVDRESRRVLGSLAIRNVRFMAGAAEAEIGGDEIAVAAWRAKFMELKELEEKHPSYQWGISRLKNGWMQFVTYQFSHSGAMHLFWNMVFLVIFGGFVETTLGSSFVVLTYVFSGLVGAWVFSQLSGISSSPLVGASASVSGLMALVSVYWWRKENVRYFYWLLPMDGYFGFTKLPSWLILIVSMLPDLSGYLGSSSDFGSIAYSAHLGGAACGALFAGALAIGLLKIEIDESAPPSDADSHDWRKAG